ncbi:hypothetical protein O181_023245 [Austropuccinia psidii MF-1]|uniref:Phosphoribosylaminoimidazole carboxylase n=1 Tax=Austropuccinia psidii MF-1 TaxID=1389203 RepID=A0A9Q3CI45_9BASI|nr:hypothetical protein [Austropuccinia psidii MF-1]
MSHLGLSKQDNPEEPVIGVLGGGQLGRMLVQAATRIGLPIVTLDQENSPGSQVVDPASAYPDYSPPLKHHIGSFNRAEDIERFCQSVDILTMEIEHVNVQILKKIAADPKSGRSQKGIKIYPSPEVIETIQDKLRQKQYLRSHNIPVADFEEIPEVETMEEVEKALEQVANLFGFPFMLKSRLLAYDGRGNFLIKTIGDIPRAIRALAPPPPHTDTKLKLYAERFVPFTCEISVMVVKAAPTLNPESQCCEVRNYPPVETIHKENICHIVYSPLRKGGPTASKSASNVARDSIDALGPGAVGVFAVEMFLLSNGTVLVNEIAPRPHNSYHHTIASTPISQFTAHLLAISSRPLPPYQSFELAVPSAAMVNILGAENGKLGQSQIKTCVDLVTSLKGVSIELYGKASCRKGRKMGHINIVGESDAEVSQIVSKTVASLPSSQTGHQNHPDAVNFLPLGFSHPNPLVSIIMGSDSDLPTMIEASRILAHPLFDVPHELTIVSAHRTPHRMVEFASEATSRGVKVIIAGAGGAAHLPGMVSAMTTLPVIGVPVKGKVLDGIDSLHSIVQMPRGIPVATVAIGNSTNAALLAIRMLSIGIPRLQGAMAHYMESMEVEVLGKVKKLEETGWEAYT